MNVGYQLLSPEAGQAMLGIKMGLAGLISSLRATLAAQLQLVAFALPMLTM